MKRIILLCLDFNASIQIQKNKEVYLKQFITRNELEQTSIQLQLSFFFNYNKISKSQNTLFSTQKSREEYTECVIRTRH